MLLTSIASVFWAVQSYAEKRTVSTGVSRNDFFFYSCLCLLPFSAIMLLLTPFYFNVNITLGILLFASLLLRYGKLTAIVSTVEFLVPYESEAYMCLGVILAYIIDCIVGIKTLSIWGIASIFSALIGVFLIADIKLHINKLRINLIIRIICDVGLGYCARYALLYCSNAMYILLLNASIVMIWGWKYTWNNHKQNKSILKLVIIQQFLGFICLYLGNIVAQQSVTAYAFIRPVSLAICVVIAFFYNGSKKFKRTAGKIRRPNIKDVTAVMLIIIGICLQTIK